MREEPRYKARIIVPIDYFATLSGMEDRPLTCGKLAEALYSLASNLKTQNILFDTEVEFIVLTQSEDHPKQSFRKELPNDTHIPINYSQLEAFLEPLPEPEPRTEILKKKRARELEGLMKARLFWQRSRKEALISCGNETIKQIVERGNEIIKRMSDNEKQTNSCDPTLYRETRNLLDELIVFFQKDEIDSLSEELEEEAKTLRIYKLLLRSLMHLESQEPLELSRKLKELCQALENASDYFSGYKMILSAEALNKLFKTQEKIPTLLILSSQTNLIGALEEHFYVVKGYYPGEPSRVDLPILEQLLSNPPEFDEIDLNTDFDGTLLNSDMVCLGVEHGTNPALAAIFLKIQETFAKTEFRLLTSRHPLHIALEHILTEILDFFAQLKKFTLLRSHNAAEESVDLKLLEKEIQSIREECRVVARKQLPDLHQEIAELISIFSKMRKFLDLELLIGTPDPQKTQKHNKMYFQEICDSIKLNLNTMFLSLENACVSKFTKIYKEKYGLSIHISNERYLARSQKNPFFKIDYIEARHRDKTKSSLVILFEDDSHELLMCKKKVFLNRNVRVITIRIHHDGCMSDEHNGNVFLDFLDEVKAFNSKKNSRSPRPEERGSPRLLLKYSNGPERSSTPAVMSRPGDNPPELDPAYTNPLSPQVYYANFFSSRNTSVIIDESGVFNYKEGSHNLKLGVLMHSDGVVISVKNLNTDAYEKFTLSENDCVTYDKIEFSRTESGQLRLEDKDVPSAPTLSNLGLQ